MALFQLAPGAPPEKGAPSETAPPDADDSNSRPGHDDGPAAIGNHGAHNDAAHACGNGRRHAAMRLLLLLWRRLLNCRRQRLLLRLQLRLLGVAARNNDYCSCTHQQNAVIHHLRLITCSSSGVGHQQR
jgi:hypothetical protein